MAKQPKRATKQEKAAAAPVNTAWTFESPESSLVLGGSYDPDTQTLTVEFTSGRSYIYVGVAQKTWEALAAAESKGKAFNSLVRPFILGREKK